jgi:hypothetical protein
MAIYANQYIKYIFAGGRAHRFGWSFLYIEWPIVGQRPTISLCEFGWSPQG